MSRSTKRSDAQEARPPRSLLRPLGIVGYDTQEPALLAALATEEPLLLVSDHGAAKTLLLTRIGEALGLALRHYNASLLQFDDLAGFPIPDERTGSIRYAAPPGAVWDAEALFIDEIGRCRPDVANKLFPLVHERRLQGIALEKLRHRWAATNPPPEAIAASGESEVYEAVEKLDPALADRFTFVLRLPRWRELSDADRTAVVRGLPSTLAPGAARQVRLLVADVQALLPAIEAEWNECAVEYVLALAPRLEEAGIVLGGRRAAMLRRAIVATIAACTALGRRDRRESFALALQSAIPDIARRHISTTTLLAAHTAAWQTITVPETDPHRLLLGVRDPARRAALALHLPDLRPLSRAEAIVGALAALEGARADLLAWHLIGPLSQRDDIPATALETVTEVVGRIANGGRTVRGFGAQAQWVTDLREHLARAPLSGRDAEYAFGALVVQYPQPLPGISAQGKAHLEGWVAEHLAFWDGCREALASEAA